MKEYKPVITIDGPSGVGKSTVSRTIAVETGRTYLDTGAMYRGVAFYFLHLDFDFDDEERIKRQLHSITLELLSPQSATSDVGVLLNGEDISSRIRTPELSMAASKISALASVRSFLTKMQRNIGKKGGIVAEGRDMGTVVFPDAEYKYFLDATAEERCQRRARQLRQKGGIVNETVLLQQIIQRDKNDSERAVAPLKKADDAVYLDTTTLSLQEVCDRILADVKTR